MHHIRKIPEGVSTDPEEIERIMEEYRQEADEFMASHGMHPFEETRYVLSHAVCEEKKLALAIVREAISPLESAIRELPCTLRLHGLFQLGGKVNPADVHSDPRAVYFVTPAFHTRFQHSELDAELGLVAGVHLGLSLEDITHLYAAGWLHDAGHSAFSHGGDELLVLNGYPNHEDRTAALLRKEEIRRMLDEHLIDVEKVITIIREKGPLGTLQKMFDTLSYLILDSGMMQMPMYGDLGADFIRNIRGIEDDMLVVDDTGVIQDFLDRRAVMMAMFYYHPVNRMVDEAMRKLLWIADSRSLLNLDDVCYDNDIHIKHCLQSMVQRDPGASMMSGRIREDGKPDTSTPLADCKELYGMTFGFFPSHTWQRRPYSPDERPRIDEFYFRNRDNKRVMEQSFVVEPYDYTRKTITVKTKDGKAHTLRTNILLAKDSQEYVLYTPRR